MIVPRGVQDLLVNRGNFIGGEFIAAASGKTLPTENPATGEIIAHIPASDRKRY
jgi:acyl-CoA reductase-like NAD-dependent aldehyde dehydrogenase